MFTPVPDIVHRPTQVLRDAASFGRLSPKVRRGLGAFSLDPSVTDIRMSLKEVFIFDNRDPGKGDIYLVTVVTEAAQKDPIVTEVKSFQDIPDRSPLQIGPAGLVVYRNQHGQTPRFFDYRILVAESDQEIRKTGEILSELAADDQFVAVRDGLVALATASQPVAALVTAAADVVIGLVAKILQMNRDDQLIYIAGSFDDKFDDLGVKYGLITHKNQYARVGYQVEAL